MKEDFFKLLALRYFQSITIKTPSPNYHLVSSCLCHWIQRVFPNHWKNHSYHSAMQYFPMHTCHQRNMIPRLLVLLTFDLLFFLTFYEIVLQKIQRFFFCVLRNDVLVEVSGPNCFDISISGSLLLAIYVDSLYFCAHSDNWGKVYQKTKSLNEVEVAQAAWKYTYYLFGSNIVKLWIY